MAIPKYSCGICGAYGHPTSAHIAMNEHDGEKAFEEILRFVGEEKLLAYEAERREFEQVYGNYLPHSSFERDPLKTDNYFNGLVDSAWNVWKLARGIE